MSTYTDLHTRRRENLTILRQPGAPEDGITPQRVIFANPENIYEGTFKGKIEAVGVSFTSVDLTDVTINGGKIKDATIYSDGREMSIANLTSNVSEINGKLDDAIENITSAQISCGDLDKRINDLIDGESGIQKISAVISVAVDNRLSSLSLELCGTVDYRLSSLESRLSNQISGGILLSSKGLSSMLKGLSGEVDAVSSYLVSAINLSASKPLADLSGEVSAISSILTNDISYLSSELSDYHNTLSGIDRKSDETHDIKSDNLILTDVNLYGGTDHSHKQYYMTFISGTVVLKPIAK